jgi:hypothetical protein
MTDLKPPLAFALIVLLGFAAGFACLRSNALRADAEAKLEAAMQRATIHEARERAAEVEKNRAEEAAAQARSDAEKARQGEQAAEAKATAAEVKATAAEAKAVAAEADRAKQANALAAFQAIMQVKIMQPQGSQAAADPAAASTDLPPLTALPPAPSALPAEYQPGKNGYLNFTFGMSPRDVVAAMNGKGADALDHLPVAGEYKQAEVHYLRVDLKSMASLPKFGAYSDSSALFFMFRKDKLFRISLRFLNDPTGQNHEPIYNAFAANNGGAVRYLYGNGKTFRVDSGNGYLIGQHSIDGVFMTFIQNNSPLSEGENYNW